MANEKRLIDANALLEKIQYRLPHKDRIAELINECVEITRKQIVDAPTVDAVEVVRCKGCKYWEQGKDYEPYCNHWGNMMTDTKADDFCSYGERRNDV